jgi:hypothetical protein
LARRAGAEAEQDFREIAEQLGLSVKGVSGNNYGYDFVVCGLRVQVKHRALANAGFIKLSNVRRANATATGYDRDAFDILALRYDGVWYLICAKVLIHSNAQTMINGLRVDNYKDYIDNWGVFSGGGITELPAQLLFDFKDCRGGDD